MSVLIKGMEMPQNLGVSVTIYPDGRVIRYLGYGAKEQLGTAAPVPPHGRLIDADALIKLLDNCMFPSDMVTTRAVSMARNWLIDAPTIIESEREK